MRNGVGAGLSGRALWERDWDEPNTPHQPPHLPQGLCVGTHVSQYDQHVLLTLVGKEFSCGQCQAWGDDSLNPGGMANR